MALNGTFKKKRLFKVSKELNVTVETLVQHLEAGGHTDALAGKGINASIVDEDAYLGLLEEFASDKATASRVRARRAEREAEIQAEEDIEAQQEDQEDEVEAPVAETPIAEAEEAPAAEAVEEAEAEADVAEEAPVEAEAPAEPEPAEPEEAPVAEPVAEAEPVATQEKQAEIEEAAEPVAEVAEAETTEAPVAEEAEKAESVEAIGETTAETTEETAASAEVSEDATSEETVAEVPEEAEATHEKAEAAADGVEEGEEENESLLTANRYQLTGTKVIGKLDLSNIEDAGRRKRKRKRKAKAASTDSEKVKVEDKPAREAGSGSGRSKRKKKRGPAVDEADVEQTLQETLRELEMGASRARQRRRRQRRDTRAAEREREEEFREEQERVLRVTEFLSTGELANLMDVQVNDVISTLFESGMIVSINQRLDADTISFIADEYDYDVEFITEFGKDDIELEEDDPEDLEARAPVVTIMGHVDHGKTSLLDYIRKTNVVAGEAGGITQHIGAYSLEVEDRNITFLDTPGHEAFTAMRARGAQVTDVVILVVAADDAVMPQTVEAINHARAAEVPMIVAINKIDKPNANPDRVMQQLADQNVLVEQYGGQVQYALVSAMNGEGVPDLLEKVLLEADLLELQANADRNASGVVIESRLDKGRGVVATVLIQNGTLEVGDTFVAGIHSGRVRAMFDERDNRIDSVGPAEPALILGFNGAPEVGDQFIVLDEERQTRDIAQKRQQIQREQALRQRKHITLEEIGRRLALGEFRELNLVLKADVGGSLEALSDSLQKLSTEEVAVNIIHSGVGGITESDVMLASASDAVIIGFQVRPAAGARAVAEREEIDVRTYSIIYDAIEDVRDALEGLLSPEQSERTLGTIEVRETFKVPKAGTIAGSYVVEGRIKRNDRIRLIRDGVVIYEGSIGTLRRFKDDVREVQSGYECGLSIDGYNDIKVGDEVEAYEIFETARKLEV